MSIPGGDTPGRFAIGQISSGLDAQAAGVTIVSSVSLIAGTATGSTAEDGFALGATIEIAVSLRAGIATGQSNYQRVGGGLPFTTRRRRKGDALAHGALIEVTISLQPGTATGDGMWQPMTEEEAIAYDNDFILLV